MSTVVVIQSNYIPWKGYFDLINDADTLIFYDDLQYTKNDWRNRNKIKTAQGVKWLSIPVGTSANRLIWDVALEDSRWQRSHWDSLRQQYNKCPYFRLYRPFFEYVYLGCIGASTIIVDRCTLPIGIIKYMAFVIRQKA